MTSESTFGDVLSEVKAAIAAGDHDRAIALTDELLLSYPDAISIWRLRAEAFSASGRPFQASEAYQRVLDIAPADADTMARLALALSASGQHAEAKLAARQALDYAPEDEALLHILASSGAEDADSLDIGPHLREGLNDVRAGLLDRGIARLNYVAAQRPDRPDVLVALAHALWQVGSRVAAAEVCQAILDVQPDCLNAHALLLALWRQIGPAGLEQAHLRAIERLDPDHSHVTALLGDASPLEVVSIPARRPSPPQPAAQEAEALDRADWVDDLVAAASSAPKPLERITPQVFSTDLAHPLESDDALIAAASSGDAGTEVASNDVVHLDDVSTVGDETIPPESLIPLEWEEAEDLLDEGSEAAPAWLPDQPGHFVPARPQRATPDVADGVPAHIEPLEWEAGEQPVGGTEAATPVAEPRPYVSKRSRPGGSPSAATAAGKAAAAREAINQSRWQEAVKLYEKAIAASRGKALDEIIADLETMRAAQPATRAVHELLGMAYARKGDVDAALDAYHRAMALAADA